MSWFPGCALSFLSQSLFLFPDYLISCLGFLAVPHFSFILRHFSQVPCLLTLWLALISTKLFTVSLFHWRKIGKLASPLYCLLYHRSIHLVPTPLRNVFIVTSHSCLYTNACGLICHLKFLFLSQLNTCTDASLHSLCQDKCFTFLLWHSCVQLLSPRIQWMSVTTPSLPKPSYSSKPTQPQ